jgi:sulfate permease, SulP family
MMRVMSARARGRTDTRRLGRALALFPSLRGYQRSWLAADALAAVTLLVIAVPEQLATSRLAGMPPITGLYAFVAGTVLFATLGSNPQISVGADSTIAPLFAVGVARLAPSGSLRYQDLVAILAVMVGTLVALVWLLRLGWISEFLSEPIITGFLAGVAVIIVVHQLPDLLGVRSGGGSTIHRVTSALAKLGHLSPWTLGVGLGVFAVVIAAERLDRRLPGALVGLVGSTLLVALLGLRRHGVAVLGSISHGAPRFGLTGVSATTLEHLAPLAGVVALVVVTQSAATTRAFSDPASAPSGAGRDFLGVGAGSIAAGLAGAFPVNASPPRTAAVAAMRGRSQLGGLLAAAGVALLVPAAGLLRNLPLSALAGILLFVASRIFHGRELVAIGRFDQFELALALITLLTVALIGVEQGIGVAVGLAVLDRARLTFRPQLHVLGRIPGSTSWAPLSSSQDPHEVPGVMVVLFATPLWYGNAAHFQIQLDRARRRAAGPLVLVVLDALGMSDLDFTGSRSLAQALDSLDRDQIAFAVARAGAHLRQNLARAGLAARIGDDHFYGSVDEAVTRAGPTAVGPGVDSGAERPWPNPKHSD